MKEKMKTNVYKMGGKRFKITSLGDQGHFQEELSHEGALI